MQNVVKLRLRRKSETGEWVVRVYLWQDNAWKYQEGPTYYTDDKRDALGTMLAMSNQYVAQGYSVL